MLIRFTSFTPDSFSNALLGRLTASDIVVCTGDGVYALKELEQNYPDIRMYALQTDCSDRGLTVSNTLTSDKLCELHVQQQQWITI